MFANSGEPRRRLHADFSLLGGLLKELFLHLKKKKIRAKSTSVSSTGPAAGGVCQPSRAQPAGVRGALLPCAARDSRPGRSAWQLPSRSWGKPGSGPWARAARGRPPPLPAGAQSPAGPRATGAAAGGAWPWGRGGALGLFSLLRFPQHPLRPSECCAPTLWASPPRPVLSLLGGDPGRQGSRAGRTRWGLGTASRRSGTSFVSPSPIPPRPPSLGQAQRSRGREAETVPGLRLRNSGGGAGQGRPGGVGSPAGPGREPAAGRRRSRS